MNDGHTFGQRLRATRVKAGYSQSDLEEISGIPKARLSRYENGHVAPSIQTLERLARALGVSEASLLGDDRAQMEVLPCPHGPRGTDRLERASGRARQRRRHRARLRDGRARARPGPTTTGPVAGRRRGVRRMASRHGLVRSRIARFRSLPPSDRTLFLIALLAIASVRVGLVDVVPACASFPRADRASDRITRSDPGRGRSDRMGGWLGGSLRPGRDLPQALAAEAILRRRGHPADLRLGVTRGDDGVEAHAWVESYGRIIVGDGDLDRFEPLKLQTLRAPASRRRRGLGLERAGPCRSSLCRPRWSPRTRSGSGRRGPRAR